MHNFYNWSEHLTRGDKVYCLLLRSEFYSITTDLNIVSLK